MRAFASRRRIAAAAGAILLVLFLVRPGAYRLKSRITNSISRAVARPTDISSVHLRFLPQPGFDLENLVIYEDPAFGAEPMLRAPEVTAVVRLPSLLRGRLDISRLELTEPSLNLVQREDGLWNLASLLERTARTPTAPTAKSKSEPRPGFPYIEASSGRINFKTGAEKKPYALLNADFALWQESENAWGVRLKAQPLRTDMSLSDTGLLRMSGTWQRAGSLRETPLQFSLDWDRAQLGQLTKLVTGNDKGWRGDVRLQAALSGTPEAMLVAADGTIQDFRRYDIPATESLVLAAHCDGKYNSAEGMMRDIACLGPVGEGLVSLRGQAGRPGTRKFDLLLNAENVPVNSVAQLARRAQKNLPLDLVAAGSVQAQVSIKEDGASPAGVELQGRGEIANLRLESTGAKAEFSTASVPFVVIGGPTKVKSSSKLRGARTRHGEISQSAREFRIEYGPFPVALGRPVAAQARGWLAPSGYALVVRGDVEVAHALRIAGLLGLPVAKANIEGAAQIDLAIAGAWAGDAAGTPSGFISPTVTGTAQLRNVRATVRGVNEPIEISLAALSLLPEEVHVEKLEAHFGDARWTGSLNLPRGCGTPGACEIRFALNTDDVALHGLYAAMGPIAKERRWYQLLPQTQPGTPQFLASLRASGTVNAARVRIHDVVATRVSAAVALDRGRLKISNLRGDVLGGRHRGEWLADFTGTSPVYTGSGALSGISLEQVADAMHDGWISGTANGSYQLKSVVADGPSFWQSAEAEFHFDASDGVLPHVSLSASDGPLRIGRWTGTARLHAGTIEIEKGGIESEGAVYEISGKASLARVLDFRLSGGPAGSRAAGSGTAGSGAAIYSITGTLGEPRVVIEPASETQARLKP